jgi:hypothetical protein
MAAQVAIHDKLPQNVAAALIPAARLSYFLFIASLLHVVVDGRLRGQDGNWISVLVRSCLHSACF